MSRFDLRELFRARTPQERVDALRLRPDLARAAVALVADERIDVQVARLEPLLDPQEGVVMLVEGRSDRRLGLLLLSTRRVLFRPHGEGSLAVRTVQLADLTTAESDSGSMTGRLALRSTAGVLAVDKILGRLADQFAAAVRTQQAARQQVGGERPPGAGPGGPRLGRDPLQELAELRSRHAAGDISTAEYEAAKARLVPEI